jgi:flagellin
MRNLGITNNMFAKSVEKLSSGLRINRAGDDAAGLTISEKLRAQVRGLNRASANAQDAISMIQTAEGALSEVHSMLQRMRELAVQGANGTLTDADRGAINSEIQALEDEIDAISTRTKFNGQYLLAGALDNSATSIGVAVDSQLRVGQFDTNILVKSIYFSNSADTNTYYFSFNPATSEFTVQTASDGTTDSILIGAGPFAAGTDLTMVWTGNVATDVWIDLDFLDPAGATLAEIGSFLAAHPLKTTMTAGNKGAAYHIGPDANQVFTVDFDSASSSSIGISTALSNLNSGTASQGEFEALITALDGATTGLAYVSDLRSNLGAAQNRLEATINSNNVASENSSAAQSRIRDVDVAAETVNFSRIQILQQAGTSVLAQANLAPQSVLNLLR